MRIVGNILSPGGKINLRGRVPGSGSIQTGVMSARTQESHECHVALLQ